MNILHLITSLKVGGAESALVNYLHKVVGQDGNTHSVAYFHLGPNVDKIRNLGIKTYQISGALSIYDPVFFFRLAKLIKFIKPDVIHSSLWSANILARLISKFSKIPVICDLHGNSFDEGRLRNWFDRKTVNYCAKIVAVSNSVRDAYLKNIIGSENIACMSNAAQNNAHSKLVVIKNGIDVQALRDKAFKDPLTRKDFGFSDSDFIIGAVGRLEPIKSYDILINAFALFLNRLLLELGASPGGDGSTSSPRARLLNGARPEPVEGCECQKRSTSQAKLVIVGDGSQASELATLVKTLKIEEHVIFTGFRPDAYKIYPIFDCFALSSQSEGLSIALLEAMAFGLPIISTNLDISRHDVITPGRNGLLVYPNDIESYAAAINKLFQDHKNGKSLRYNIGNRNLALVKSEFCIDGVVDKYQQLYQAVVSGDFSKKL